MKAFRITSDKGIGAIELVDAGVPAVGPGEVRVTLKAASLNYRDLVIAKGGYLRNQTRPVTPLSDGAGVVDAVGAGVSRWKVGDRVAANFMRDWVSGALHEAVLHTALGGAIDGVLAEQFVVPQHALVRVPGHLDFAEAATLPCAALTAWNALMAAGTKAGDTVLVLGSGGVSIFALQFARAMGARVIATSASDEKLARVRGLGAAETINYKVHPKWHEQVLQLTGGKGVDHVIEIGGTGTFESSLQSTRVGGTISLIGFLAGGDNPSVIPAILNAQTVRGIYVGSVEMFEAMNRAIEVNQLKPVIDKRFAFADSLKAYAYFESQAHVGKVVITRD
ncbi:MAG: NAD(P)-dependent alcohol dehydrogenase [Phycisphaerales bacterium]|jgi:NADPH:quinone reductase-like Zn-dependent oxidoreductase